MMYAIQIVIYSAILWLLYLLFLRDKPMHRFNRAYLLLTSILPVVLPFIKLPYGTQLETYRSDYLNIRLPEITITDGRLSENAMTLSQWLLAGYAVVCCLFIVFCVRQWLQVTSVIRKSKKQNEEGYILLLHTGYGPGSWGKYIFLPEGETDPRILQHELAHIRLRHTADNILLMVLQCFCWFNPFLYFIKNELRIVQEYQADALAADKTSYGHLLLANALNACTLPLAHSFFHHPIKRRIMMLNKKLRRFPAMINCTLAAVCLTVFVTTAVSAQSAKQKGYVIKKDDKITDTVVTDQGDVVIVQMLEDSVVYKEAASMPQFIGGNEALTKYLIANLKYPPDARKEKIQGRVIVQFYINVEGVPKGAYVSASPDPRLSAAAIDVVEKMPKWIPGENEQGKKIPVWFTLPVQFKL